LGGRRGGVSPPPPHRDARPAICLRELRRRKSGMAVHMPALRQFRQFGLANTCLGGLRRHIADPRSVGEFGCAGAGRRARRRHLRCSAAQNQCRRGLPIYSSKAASCLARSESDPLLLRCPSYVVMICSFSNRKAAPTLFPVVETFKSGDSATNTLSPNDSMSTGIGLMSS
jgi:hypothetical protein